MLFHEKSIYAFKRIIEDIRQDNKEEVDTRRQELQTLMELCFTF